MIAHDERVFRILCAYQTNGDGLVKQGSDDHAIRVAAEFKVSRSTVWNCWCLSTMVAKRVWKERRAEIHDEWTRRGAPEWRV